MKITLATVLKYLAAGGSFLVCFPVLFVINAGSYDTFYPWMLLGQTALAFVCGFIGMFAGILIRHIIIKQNWKLFAERVLCGTGALLPVLLNVLFLFHSPVTVLCGTMGVSIFAYCLGLFYSNRTYSQIMNNAFFQTYCFVAIASVPFILWMSGDAGNLTYLAEVSIVFLLIYLICKNQTNLDYMMERRKHKKEQLPAKIRRYNLFLIGGISVLVLAAFFLRNVLADIFSGLVEVIRNAISSVMTVGPGEEISDVVDENVVAPAEGMDNTNYLFGTIFLAIILAVIAVVFIILVVKVLLPAFRELMQRLRYSGGLRGHEKNEDYTDEEVMLDKDAGSADGSGGGKSRRYRNREWKKAYRAFLAMEDSPEKFRRGYALILGWFDLHGKDLPRSDTPLEILHKTREWIKKGDFDRVTEQYNQIRYAVSGEYQGTALLDVLDYARKANR